MDTKYAIAPHLTINKNKFMIYTEYCKDHKSNIIKKLDLNMYKQNQICPKCIELLYRETDEYKQNVEYVKSNIIKTEELKSQYCTGHILNKTLILNKNIRIDHCIQCKQQLQDGLNSSEIKEETQMDLIKKELVKLNTVKLEIKCAFTNLLNTNSSEVNVLINTLYTMQDNIITNDINRFTKELNNLKIQSS